MPLASELVYADLREIGERTDSCLARLSKPDDIGELLFHRRRSLSTVVPAMGGHPGTVAWDAHWAKALFSDVFPA